MLGILNAPKQVIQKNLKLLAEDYKEKTGRVVCLNCPSDIQYMISSLKQIYKIMNFEFKRNAAQYKNKKGDKTTISNATLTDEKAIEFLKTNPERIGLFSKFPENWQELIKEEPLSEEELEAKKAEQAANEALNEGKKEEDCCDESTEEAPCEECKEKKRQELSKMKLADLRAAYPEIKATSIKDFVEKVVNQ